MEADALYKSVRMCAEIDSAKIEGVEEANLHVHCKILYLSFTKTRFVFSKCVIYKYYSVFCICKRNIQTKQKKKLK